MTTIYQRIEKYFTKDRAKVEKELRKELIHTRVEELYRGKPLFPEKIKGIIKILVA